MSERAADVRPRRGSGRVLGWLADYHRSWIPMDVVAGLTVTAILIPEGMAYAQLAGVGPEAAFYAAPAALLLYAALGSSRQLVVAVSSAVAITSAATVAALAPQGSAEYVSLTAALALLAGLISLGAGVLRLGRIARFFSASVLLGFVFGLALIITLRQVPKLLGVHVDAEEFFAQVVQIVRALPDTSVVTLAVGMSCMTAMVVVQRFMPKLPAALVVLVGSIVASSALDLGSHGVAVVGELPSGLAAPTLPHVGWDAVPLLFAGAAGIALLAFAEAMGPAHQLAEEHGYEVDANRELVAIGAANAGAGLFQGFPIGASLSKSAANDRAGARTPMSLVIAALATALVALFLTPLFRELPEAALAAIVIVAVSEMERIEPLRRLWRVRRADGVLALTALFGVLLFDILPGLAIAVVASLGVVVWRAGAPRVELSRGTPDGSGPAAGAVSTPRLLVVRPDQMMFFVNATEIRDAVTRQLAAAEAPDVVLLDIGLTPDLDVPSCDVLREMHDRVTRAGGQLWVVTEIPEVRRRLDVAGLTELIGSERIFPGVAGAVLTYLYAHSAVPTDARRVLLADILDLVRKREGHPGLDDEGRAGLAAVEATIEQMLDDGTQCSD